jgi:hypothetical protein
VPNAEDIASVRRAAAAVLGRLPGR